LTDNTDLPPWPVFESDAEAVTRLEQMFTSPYDTDGDNLNALITAFASEFDESEQVIKDILDQKFVESATGEYLNKIGSLFDFERRRDETEDAFRARIQTGLRAQLSSATIPEVKDVAALILDVNTNDFTVEERFDITNAEFSLDVSDYLDDAGLTPTEFIDIIDRVTAAGVSVGILLVEEQTDTTVIEEDHSVQFTQIEEAYWNEARVGVDFYA